MNTETQSGSHNSKSRSTTTTETAESHPYADLTKCDTNNATKFYPQEQGVGKKWKPGERWKNPDAFRYPNKEKMWGYLEQLHRGTRNGKWTNDAYYTHAENVDIVENFAYQMGLTKAETTRAKAAFFTVHPDLIKGERKDVTAAAVCAYIGEESGRPYHPQKLEEGRPLAEKYAGMFGCSAKEVVSRYGKVQYHLRGGISPEREMEVQLTENRVVDACTEDADPTNWYLGSGWGVY